MRKWSASKNLGGKNATKPFCLLATALGFLYGWSSEGGDLVEIDLGPGRVLECIYKASLIVYVRL